MSQKGNIVFPLPKQIFYLELLPRVSDADSEKVAGIAPHRQLNQKCTAELHYILRDGLHKIAAAYPSLIQKGSSCFEKHGLALFLSACTKSAPSSTADPGFSHLNPTCKDTGEICHLHAIVSYPARQTLRWASSSSCPLRKVLPFQGRLACPVQFGQCPQRHLYSCSEIFRYISSGN